MSEGIGKSGPRKEDGRFITGKGRYTDDIKQVGQSHAYFVRSPHAHARSTRACHLCLVTQTNTHMLFSLGIAYLPPTDAP